MTKDPCNKCLIKPMCQTECPDFVQYRKFLSSRWGPLTILFSGLIYIVFLITVIVYYDNNQEPLATFILISWLVSIISMIITNSKVFFDEIIFLSAFAPFIALGLIIWTYKAKQINKRFSRKEK